MAKPPKPTVPAPPLRSNPSTFSALAEGFLNFFQPFADYLDEVADFTDAEADAATAAALAGDLPGLGGEGGNALLVNPAEDGLAFGKVPVLLASQDMTGQTEFVIDSTNFDETRFHGIQFYMNGIQGSPRLQTSSDGTTFDSGASDYYYQIRGQNPIASTSDDEVILASGISRWTGEMFIHTGANAQSDVFNRCSVQGFAQSAAYSDCVFARVGTAAIRGVRIYGGFVAGRITAMGIPR